MVKAKKSMLTVAMVLIWGITAVLLVNTTHARGFFSILGSGVLINALLAVYYSCVGQRIGSLRQWLNQ